MSELFSGIEPDVLSRWKGVFRESIYQVFQNCGCNLGLDRDAQEYLEALLVKLIRQLCRGKPHSIDDAEKQVNAIIPYPMNEWAHDSAREVCAKAFPTKKHRKISILHDHAFVRETERVGHILKDPHELGYKADPQAVVYILAIVESLAIDMLKLAINFVLRIGDERMISMKNMSVFFSADEIYHELFYHQGSDQSLWSSTLPQEHCSNNEPKESYDSIVTHMMSDETQFLRDLNLLLHVFYKALLELATKSEMERIFGNIFDVHEFSMKFMRSLEDTREMSETPVRLFTPTVGACFNEMAEGCEFEVFLSYASTVLSDNCANALNSLLNKPLLYNKLEERALGFFLSVKYLLPRLLLGPIVHCYNYFEKLESLCSLAECSSSDEQDLKQSQSLLRALKTKLDPLCSPIFNKPTFINDSLTDLLKYNTPRLKTVQQVNKSLEIQKKIDGLDEIFLCYKYNVVDGVLGKMRYNQSKLALSSSGSDTLRRAGKTDRHIFLLDHMIVLTKAVNKKVGNNSQVEFKLKEKIYITKARLRDRQDTEDVKYSFELVDCGEQQERVFTLFAQDLEEKRAWIAAIMARKMARVLDRILESILKQEDKRVPLVYPSPMDYRFSEADSEDSIIYEDYTSSSGMPVVKGGTVLKLVERLTHHVHHDLKFVQTFLTTYRSFCSSSELLSLLIERFNIPTPQCLNCTSNSTPDTFTVTQGEPVTEQFDPLTEQQLQKFRKEFARPVQIRVLSVIGKWVNHHWYDFNTDHTLLQRLKDFLCGVMSHVLQKYIKAILSQIEKRQMNDERENQSNILPVIDVSASDVVVEHDSNKNGILWHLAEARDFSTYDLMTLHPIEIARFTLLESELYRAVKTIELVGAAWMKKIKIEDFHTVFEELNNFNGLMEIYSVLLSAAVYRLKWTTSKIESKNQKYYDRLDAMFKDRHVLYKKRLREINPPCVPFFGMYLTNIFLMEEGNSSILRSQFEPNELGHEDESSVTQGPLISFHKCRKIAEIITEIQMYQNQRYEIVPEESIQSFFESLNPLRDFEGDKNKFETYLWEKSADIEPKDCDKPPYFPPVRQYPLKSPGIKQPSKTHHKRPTIGNISLSQSSTPIHFMGQTSHEDDRISRRSPMSPVTQDTTNSDFALVVIDPATGPRYVSDVPDNRMRHKIPSSRLTPPSSSPPPPLPPRLTPRLGAASPFSHVQLSPVDVSPPSPSVNSSHFLFPSPPPALPPKSYNEKDTHLVQLNSRPNPAAVRLPPPMPAAMRHSPLPPPLSPSVWSNADTEVRATPSKQWDWCVTSGNSSDVHNDSSIILFGGDQSHSSPPPLPPRAIGNSMAPPPRPPKSASFSDSNSPPPLPPKTYKSRTRIN